MKARQPGRSAAAGRPGQVRIIAGRLRGSKLAVPPIDGLRPTADRVRDRPRLMSMVTEGSV